MVKLVALVISKQCFVHIHGEFECRMLLARVMYIFSKLQLLQTMQFDQNIKLLGWSLYQLFGFYKLQSFIVLLLKPYIYTFKSVVSNYCKVIINTDVLLPYVEAQDALHLGWSRIRSDL